MDDDNIDEDGVAEILAFGLRSTDVQIPRMNGDILQGVKGNCCTRDCEQGNDEDRACSVMSLVRHGQENSHNGCETSCRMLSSVGAGDADEMHEVAEWKARSTRLARFGGPGASGLPGVVRLQLSASQREAGVSFPRVQVLDPEPLLRCRSGRGWMSY